MVQVASATATAVVVVVVACLAVAPVVASLVVAAAAGEVGSTVDTVGTVVGVAMVGMIENSTHLADLHLVDSVAPVVVATMTMTARTVAATRPCLHVTARLLRASHRRVLTSALSQGCATRWRGSIMIVGALLTMAVWRSFSC